MHSSTKGEATNTPHDTAHTGTLKRFPVIESINAAPRRALDFLKRQKSNYRVAITRSSASSFLLNLTAQYDAIYTVGLGADSVLLGTINSIGNGISALLATPIGWLVDRYGIKTLYTLAMALMAAGALCYAVAPSWELIGVATILFALAMRLTGTGCSVISADSVKNHDRATAQNLCVSFASIASLVAPLAAAYLITRSGGLSTEGIRPLYYVRFVGYGLILLFVALKLREPDRAKPDGKTTGVSFVEGFKELFVGQPVLRRWVIVAALTRLPMAMITPFMQLYAHEVKGADQYLLGVMTTVTILARLAFGIPLGRLADRIGRKKVIYMLTPIWYASYLLLAFSTSPATLLISAGLQTFYAIASGATSAMTMELVPLEKMGKWSGALGLFQGLVSVPAPLLGGLLWRELGPIYVLLVPIVVDLVLRVPLFATIPETLRTERATQNV